MATVAKKLGILPGNVVGFAGLDPAKARRFLEDLPAGAELRERDGSPADQLILVADGFPSLQRMLPRAWDEVKPGGRLWVWYRKGATRGRLAAEETPLHRDSLQTALAEFGLVGVALISVDETWSSMRVRPL